MKYLQRPLLLALVAGLAWQVPAHAVVNGIIPSTAAGAPPIINPFTNQATDAWKLVGYLGCSAFQISREWVIQAGHCALAANATGTYSGHLGSSTVLGSDCTTFGAAGGDDFQLCRLKNPENLTPFGNYPAMVALPAAWRTDTVNAIKYGSLMGYGHATAGDGLAFVSLDGYPYNFDPAAPNLTPYPIASGGDSGGARFWFPPSSGTAYMVGVLVNAGGVAGARLTAFYFREDNLASIKSIIQARGDTPPNMPAISSVFTPPTGNPAPRLPAPATISRVGNNASAVLQWSTPSATPAVSQFKVSISRNGVLDNSFYVQAGASSNQVTLNLNSDKYLLCIRPYNAIGASQPADSFAYDNEDWAHARVSSANCQTLDNRSNQSTITGLAATGNTLVSSQVSVNFGWGTTVSPADLSIANYRVTQAVSYGTGPSRTTTTTVTGTRASVILPKGSKVCITVAAVAVNGRIGPVSPQVCALAN